MKKILVGYNGGDEGRRALQTTIELANALGGEVLLISVVPRHPGRMPEDPWDDHTVHMAELYEAQRVLREQGIEPELIEPHGDPAREIEAVAAARAVDIVVVAPRDIGALGRILQGSVSDHVATHATATVVVAR